MATEIVTADTRSIVERIHDANAAAKEISRRGFTGVRGADYPVAHEAIDELLYLWEMARD